MAEPIPTIFAAFLFFFYVLYLPPYLAALLIRRRDIALLTGVLASSVVGCAIYRFRPGDEILPWAIPTVGVAIGAFSRYFMLSPRLRGEERRRVGIAFAGTMIPWLVPLYLSIA